MTKKINLRLGLRYKNKNISLKAVRCGFWEEGFGLMFQTREKAEALLFNFTGRKRLALHSLFVFFPFLVVWLDDKNKILENRMVRPFSLRVLSKKSFSKIVEIPLNLKYKKIIKNIVGKRKI